MEQEKSYFTIFFYENLKYKNIYNIYRYRDLLFQRVLVFWVFLLYGLEISSSKHFAEFNTGLAMSFSCTVCFSFSVSLTT